MPQDDLFADEASPATAAIMLGNPADTLGPGAVRGMAQLTASSVKGLKTDNVTITDSSGAMLWPSTDGSGGAGGGSSKASAETRKARAIESSINAMLASTLGPGKAQVKVNADLNMDETTQKELTYAAKGTPLKTTEETEKLTGSGATTGGTAGTGSNVPTYSGANAAGGRQVQLLEQEEHAGIRRQQEGDRHQGRRRRRQQAQRRAAGRQVGPAGRVQLAQADRRHRRGHRRHARRHDHRDPDGLRQARRAQGRPGARPRCSAR